MRREEYNEKNKKRKIRRGEQKVKKIRSEEQEVKNKKG
jgi:hypothetical protein